MIQLIPIDEGNWRTPLTVAAHQRNWVADRTTLLARAYAYRNSRSFAFLVCHGAQPVGMGLYHDCDELGAYDLSQLFIDERYQGRGYGKAAAKLVLERMRQDGKYPKVILCYIEGNEAARRLYEGLGFRETDRDEDELIMERDL